jgi:uncharacterized protein (DUF1800 family)
MVMADRALVAHVLRRATFGPTATEVDAAQRDGVEATVARLLDPGGVDPGALDTPEPTFDADPNAALGPNPSRDQRQQAQQTAQKQVETLLAWWVSRMVAAQHQLTEKMIFFWHGHWATSVQKVKSATLMQTQLTTFRTSGRGDFGAFTKAMLHDPALIIWLDGQRNTKQAPNENLSRELMELFTLGVGNYTEDDVRQGAKALTGWTIDAHTLQVRFVAGRHDAGNKTVLGQTANFDADSFADLLVSQPANASHLATRLWFRFASPTMTADTESRLVSAYRRGNDVTALVTAVLADPEFPGTRGALVKQPVEWLVGALRQLGIAVTAQPDSRPGQLLTGLEALGQLPLEPPSVGGWPANAAWLTTSSLQARLRLSATLAGAASPAAVDALASGDTNGRLDALARLLVVDEWTDRTRAALQAASSDPHRLLTVGLASPEYTVV